MHSSRRVGRRVGPQLQRVMCAGALLPSVICAQSTNRVRTADRSPTADTVRVDTLWRVGDRQTEPQVTTFAAVTAVQVDSANNVLVLELREGAVRVLDASGQYVRSFGRTGSGPGELRVPTSLAVGPGGRVYVYDAGTATISEFSRAYDFIRTVRPSPLVGDVRNFLVMGDRIYIAGVGRIAPLTGATIHVFSLDDGRHLFSFGTLPPAASLDISYLLGAGFISRARGGAIWYAQRAPYALRKYSQDGALLVEIERPNDFLPRGDSAFNIIVDGGRVTTSARPHAFSLRVLQLDDGSLVHQTRLADGRFVTDFFSPTFALVASAYAVPGLSAPIGGDRFASLLRGGDDVPTIAAVRVHLPK